MAEIHWLNPVNGNWDKASDWSGGVVPGGSDDVFLDASGSTDYTVKVQGADSVNTLHVNVTATLDIGTAKEICGFVVNGLVNAGSIIVGKGSFLSSGFGNVGNVVNSGRIVAKKGGNLVLLNTINNTGLIEIDKGSILSEVENTFVGSGTIDLLGGSISGGVSNTTTGYMTNVDNLIEGFGVIGGAKHRGIRLVFINEAAGVVNADAKGGLTIETGALTITNAGLIEATNGGVCVVKSTVSNTGTLEANGGTLMLERAVSGSGKVAVAAGTLAITNAGAAEAVTFAGQSGTLELNESQTYSGKVKGFSLTGQTTLDLRDIGFVSPTEATYSGTNTSGILTVTDGTHTAHINLVGDYTGSTFVASSDGKGGVSIVDPSADTPSVAHFAHAMATLGGLSGGFGAGAPHASTWDGRSPMLAFREQR